MHRKSTKFLSLLLALIMVVSMLPMSALAVDGASSGSYAKISTIEELTTGKYVMVAGNGYAPTVLDGKWVLAAEAAATEGVIASPAANMVWTLTVDDSNVKLTDSNGITIAPMGGNSNGIKSGDYNWAVSCENGLFKFAGQGGDTVVLASNSDAQYANKFRGYKTATVVGNPDTYPSEFTLYKLSSAGGETPSPEEPAEPTGEKYELMTSAPAAGDVVIMYNAGSGTAMTSTKTSYYYAGEALTPAEGVIITDSEAVVWTVGLDNGVYSFTQGENKMSAYASGKYFNLDMASEDSGWTLSECNADNGSFYVYSSTLTGQYGNVYLEWYGAKNAYSAYCTGADRLNEDVFGFQFYKLAEEETEEPAAPKIADGNYVIWVPAYYKALSATKTDNYNVGTDVYYDTVLAGYGETEIWSVTNNDDGTICISNGGQNLGMADQYSSMNLGAVNDKWELIELGDGLYNVKNVVRGNFIEWYAQYSNWSTYNSASAATDGQFQIKFDAVTGVPETPVDPPVEPPVEPEKPDVTYIEKMNELPEDGDTVVIYNSGNAMASAANGKKMAGVAAELVDGKLPLAEEMAQLLVTVEDGKYIFSLDGKYLTSAPTGNGLSLADELSDCGKWTMEAAVDGAWYIKNAGANYNGNYNQAMEYYSGFTTYGIKENEIYQMQLFLAAEGEDVPAEPEVTYIEKMNELPGDGDTVVIYNSGNAMASAANGKKMAGVAAELVDGKLPLAEEMAQLLVTVEDGKYIFSLDGKYLTSAPTGNGLSLADELSDCGKWTIEAATDGAWYIKNAGANYNGNYNQAMEYYSGFTTYGIKENEIYQMQLFLAAEGEDVPAEPEVTYIEKMNELPEDGDTVVIYNSGNAMASAANGKKMAGVAAELVDGKLPLAEEMAQLLVTVEDGKYIFSLDGKYLTSALTGNGLSLADELSDCGKWTIEKAVDGAWYIKNAGANYNGNYNQAMEYYSGFTTYGIKENEIYQMQLFLAEKGEPAPGEPGKVTSAEDFISGNYVMVVSTGYAPGVLEGNWVTTTQPVIENGAVTDAKGAVWTLAVDGNSVIITDSNGASIAPKGGNSNGIASGSYSWAWSFNEANATFTFKGTGSDTVTLASNANEDGGFHRFRGYKNTTVAGNSGTYPCEFTLYKVEAPEGPALPAEGAKVVLYNLSAQGVLAAENDTKSIENTSAEIVDETVVPGNGAVIFEVRKNGEYYRFYNETYGYLCSNGTGNNAFYSLDASEDADWTITSGKSGGYNLESRTAKFNGTYSQYLEYYADSYKTYSMYKVTDYDIYEFLFYPVAEDINVTEGIVNAPSITIDNPGAYKGKDWVVNFTVDAVFGIKDDIKVLVYGRGSDAPVENAAVLAGPDGEGKYSVTVAADVIDSCGAAVVLDISLEDVKGNAFGEQLVADIIDEPSIGEISPAANSETGKEKKPTVSAELINIGENAVVTMTINGEEVETVVADGIVSYTPAEAMADGRTTVTVEVTRADGKAASKSWSFTVGEAQYALYFGQLHSHTTYSDGSGSLESALNYIASLPESANVDFVAFTDHSNYFDGSSASTTANPEGALYDMSLASEVSQSIWNEYTGTMDAFNARQSDVIAIPGFEMTWSGGPGHINTFNTPGIVSRNNTTLNNKTADAGMKAYYALLSQEEGINSLSQFNHPGSTFGTFTDFAYWDAVIDTRIQMVEVGNGEGAIHAGGYYPSYEYYTMALDKGWHLAPTNNQDNHKGKWGNANDARDVILTDDFSEEGIYAAIRAMRMYATEDKNLEISYSVNGQLLGSTISEVPESLSFDVSVYDPDVSDSISKVEVIVNSGKVAHIWDDPAQLSAGVLTAELAPDYSYYYIRVTEGDGDIAVTAPVWVGETLKLGISAVETATSTPVTNEELTISTTLFNSETTAASVKTLTYTVGSQVIGTDSTGYTIPASGTCSIDFGYIPELAKLTTVTVTAVVDLEGVEYVFTMDIELDVQDASKLVYIGIDASHYNEYVAGNYKDSMGNFGALAAEYGVRTVQLNTSEDLIAACSNTKYKALILTAPSRRDGDALRNPYMTYSDAEIDAIKAFNSAGGAVILTGWGDYYESYTSFPAEDHMAAQQNKLLAALGSSLRIADDETKDDSYNGGQAQRLYLSVYDFDNFLLDGVEYDAQHPHDNMYTELYSQYGGASIYVVDSTGAATASIPESVTPAVYAFDTTYSADDDNDDFGGLGSTQKYTIGETQNLMVLATEELPGHGLIVVAGAAFLSNFEVQATIEDSGSEKNYSNYKICENLIKYLNPVTVTDIADVQAQTEVGYKYTIEGVVTSNASGYDKDTAFFDCIYVQDATGGICCFPVAGNYKIGDLVRVTGTTEFYQGEMELQVTDIEVIGSGSVEAKAVDAAAINDLSVIGQLVTVSGTVTGFDMANGLVQTIMVRDAKDDTARVFIDGYITTDEDVQNLSIGCKITVTGLASYDNTFNAPEGPFPRIRVRDRADVVCSAVPANPVPAPMPDEEAEFPFIDVNEGIWYYDSVYKLWAEGIMNGVSEEAFAPGNTLNRAMLATMLYRLSGEEYSGEGSAFEDVAEGKWYSDAIAWCSENGIVTGYSDTAFAPERAVSREQAVTMLYRFAKYMECDVSVGEDTNILSYIDAFDISEYAIPAMQWAVGAGIIEGVSEDSLAPAASSTRAQIACMFARFVSWCE